MAISFRGGICPDEAKITATAPIQELSAGNLISIPIPHYEGGSLTPLVKEGDSVLVGQRIAEGEGVCCPLFSGVSGVVRSIREMDTPTGREMGIEIENDFKMTLSPTVQPFSTPLNQASPEELLTFIREKGISGMGGSGFPTWVKIEKAMGKAERIVVNVCESEPYLTSNHRLCLEKAREIVGGAKILLRIIGCEKVIFATEDNKEDAAEALLKVFGKNPHFGLAVLKTKYPQGDERLLCHALRGKEIPQGLGSVDVGIAVFNVQTVYAIYRAFVEGMPPVSKVITVSGECVKDPANLSVPFGVSLSEIFLRCGGFSSPPDAIVCGGPMMGLAAKSTEIPFTNALDGLLAMREHKVKEENCIRCGRCLKACPMHLMPYELYRAAQKKKVSKLERYEIASCTDCGSCTWVCPAGIDLAGALKEGKALLKSKER